VRRLVLANQQLLVEGNILIGAMSPESMVGYISKGDLVILGDRENAQEAALGCDISCLIITGNFALRPTFSDWPVSEVRPSLLRARHLFHRRA